MLLMSAGFVTKADDIGSNPEAKIIIEKHDGNQQEFNLSDISRLNFGDNTMTVISGTNDNETVFQTSSLLEIKFVYNVAAIDEITGITDEMKLYYNGEHLYAKGIEGNTVHASIYGIDGKIMETIAYWDGTPISTASLPQGIYVFKANNNTLKFIKK